MKTSFVARLWACCLWLCLGMTAAAAQGGAAASEASREVPPGPLVQAAWLKQQLGRDDLVLIDASPGGLYARQHIPGAVHADLFSFGGREQPPELMQRQVQGWGVSPDKTVVLYDQDGLMWATRVFFDLVQLGFPVQRLRILDGGILQWRAQGGAVATQATAGAAPAGGVWPLNVPREDLHVRLPEFLNATADPAAHAIVEALEPSYYYGGSRFFSRAGHVPHAKMLPRAHLFQADGRFKPPAELRRLFQHLGIGPEQRVMTYCGGGVAATLPFFAMKYLLGYPDVRVYLGSQLEWTRDERGLPLWTYAAPYLLRDGEWLAAWNNPMFRATGVAGLGVVDLRSDADYRQGHVPHALPLPAALWREHAANAAALQALPARLGPAGLDPAHEAVIVADGGVTPDAALAFLVLQALGQQRVSLLMDSVDEWALAGRPLAKTPTVVGARHTPQDLVVPAAVFNAAPRRGRLVHALPAPAAGDAGFPRLFLAAGRTPPSQPVPGPLVHLPYTELLTPQGQPLPAMALWNRLEQAGVERYAEIVCVADAPGDAAVSCLLLQLMGFPDTKLWVR